MVSFSLFSFNYSLLLTTFQLLWSVNCQQLLWTTHDNDRQRTTTRRVDTDGGYAMTSDGQRVKYGPKRVRLTCFGPLVCFFGTLDWLQPTNYISRHYSTDNNHTTGTASSHSCHTTTDDATRKPPPPRHTTRCTTSQRIHDEWASTRRPRRVNGRTY